MEHPYCYYSFEYLDPQNPEPALRSFVCCANCGKTFHKKYWLELKKCLNCQQTESIPLLDVPPIVFREDSVVKHDQSRSLEIIIIRTFDLNNCISINKT